MRKRLAPQVARTQTSRFVENEAFAVGVSTDRIMRPTTAMLNMFKTAGMTEEDLCRFLRYLPRGTETVRIMYRHMSKYAVKAQYRPIARMQLIRTASKGDLIMDRALWLWATVWTIKCNMKDDLIGQGLFMGSCVTCALYTGCFCDDCNGPICTKCDSDEDGEHVCALCIHSEAEQD